MNWFHYKLICLLALISANICGQEKDIQYSGNFRDVQFQEFIHVLEETTRAQFYYLDEWIRGIRITASGKDISLRKTLDDALRPAGLNFIIDEDLRVFIFNKSSVVTSLPDYTEPDETVHSLPEDIAVTYLTNSEERYIEGKKTGPREVLVVGSAKDHQTAAVINGKMVDAETSEPLIGATIYIVELKKGAATDVDGNFNIVLDPGRYNVDFNCMGMETEFYVLEVRSGGNLLISMNKSLIPITEVVVEASRFHNVKGTQMGFERLNYKTVKEVPLVLGEKDLLKVAQMLPGIQSVGEGATGFNVRGSSADQNMICRE